MKLTVTDASKENYNNDGTVPGARGGTEMMAERLNAMIDGELLKDFKIIHSRVRDRFFEEGKKHILLCHDTAGDPEAQHLSKQESRNRFAKICFVSNYQYNTYRVQLGVPYGCSTVMRNAIVPIEKHDKNYDEQIRFIYHTTPHRGLHILVAVFDELYKQFGDKIHLDVYSSFEIYNSSHRDDIYKQVFAACEEHPGISNHGTVSNEEIRKALKRAHVFAYPSIWEETSCIAAIEAMSAKCAILCPSYAALPETTGGFAFETPFDENVDKMANAFYQSAVVLTDVLVNQREKFFDSLKAKVEFQSVYAEAMYNIEDRVRDWNSLLTTLKNDGA